MDGLLAFEGVEDDRANSHPAGQPHITVNGNNLRAIDEIVGFGVVSRYKRTARSRKSAGYFFTAMTMVSSQPP